MSAAAFIGLTVRIALVHPPNEVVRGTIAEVGAGQALVLTNATTINGHYHQNLVVPAGNVQELDIESGVDVPAKEPSSEVGFDPAILSYGRKPNQPRGTSNGQARRIGSQEKTRGSRTRDYNSGHGTDSATSATLAAPFSNLSVTTTPRSAVAKDAEDEPTPVRKEFLVPKTDAVGGNDDFVTDQDIPTTYIEKIQTPNEDTRGKRRRPRASAKAKPRVRQLDDPNGWATEDATDIQDLGEFDFLQNLTKFDKHKVFAQIRHEDTTADEDRLHYSNRRPRPGTAGGKNLHYTENVLESPKLSMLQESSADEGLTLSRRESDRVNRRTSMRQGPSRKGSGHTGAEPLSLARSGSKHSLDGARPTSVNGRRVALAELHNRSGLNKAFQHENRRRFFSFTGSNETCPHVSPLQMLELEQETVDGFFITEDMMGENAGRCIAETAIEIARDNHAASDDGDASTLIMSSLYVIILCGNTKTGARTIAGARHLRNRNVQVIVCIISTMAEESLLECVQRQLQTFRLCGGRIIRHQQLRRTVSRLPLLSISNCIIVEAMLGMHLSFDDLLVDDQAAYISVLDWAHTTGTQATILSIDVPAGIDPNNGAFGRHPHTGQAIGIMPAHVLCVGAPKSGLLTAGHEAGHDAESTPQIWVADIGIPTAAWARLGKKGKKGVQFSAGASGGGWVEGIEIVDGE